MSTEPESDEALIARLTQSKAALLSLTSWYDTAPSILWTVAKLGTDEMRAHVASAASLPTDLEEYLAARGDEQTKIALAYRYRLSDTTLASLVEGASDEVRRLLTARHDAPAWLVEEAATSPDAELRRSVLRSPHLTVESLQRLALDGDAEVRVAAQATLAQRAAIQPQDGSSAASLLLAGHALLTADAAASLAEHPSRDVRAALATNPRTPGPVLARLAKDADVLVRMLVLGHSGLPTASLDRLLDDRVSSVRQTLARRGDLGTERLLHLARDSDLAVRETVAMRPQLAPEVIAVLRAAADPIVNERLDERALLPERGSSLALLWGLLDASLEVASDPFLRGLLERGLREHLTHDRWRLDVLDSLIATLDQAYSRAMDAILHSPRFQELERRWRGLYAIVQASYLQRPVRANNTYPGAITCEFLNCSKEDLIADFEDAPALPKSGLHKLVYSAEYGPFGGRPYALLHVDFTFLARSTDVRLLSQIGGVAESAALVVASKADAGLLGVASMDALVAAGPSKLEGAVGTAWASLQRDPLSRHLALFVQEVVGREPYHRTPPSEDGPQYTERVSEPADVVWLPGSLALVQAAARSFHYWRVSSHVTGPEDAGFDGAGVLPAEAWRPYTSLSHELTNLEADVAAAGFATLRAGKAAQLYISLAPSCHTGDCGFSDLAEEDRVRNREVAGTLWITRWMQLLKVMQREQIGTWREQTVLEMELNLHLESYCRVPQAAPGSALLSMRAPLRAGSVRLDGRVGAGWYGANLSLQPGWRLEGRFPTYRLRNRLDKE